MSRKISEDAKRERLIKTEQRTKINRENAKDVIQEATQEVKVHARQLGMLLTPDDISAAHPIPSVPKDLESDHIPALDEWKYSYDNIFEQLDEELFYRKSKENWIQMFVALKYHKESGSQETVQGDLASSSGVVGTEIGDRPPGSSQVIACYRFRKLVSYVMASYPHPCCRGIPEANYELIAKEMVRTVAWVWNMHGNAGKRKYLSHVGGHLADWIFTEMLERTGRRIK